MEQRECVTFTSRVSKFFLADIAATSAKAASSLRDIMQDQALGSVSLSSFTNMIKLLADGKKEFSYSDSKITYFYAMHLVGIARQPLLSRPLPRHTASRIRCSQSG